MSKRIVRPHCNCTDKKDDNTKGNARVVSCSDGETCDECGYYVTWREEGKYVMNQTRDKESDFYLYEQYDTSRVKVF